MNRSIEHAYDVIDGAVRTDCLWSTLVRRALLLAAFAEPKRAKNIHQRLGRVVHPDDIGEQAAAAVTWVRAGMAATCEWGFMPDDFIATEVRHILRLLRGFYA